MEFLFPSRFNKHWNELLLSFAVLYLDAEAKYANKDDLLATVSIHP